MHSQGVGGLALGEDGRLFMAGLDLAKREGAILACSPDTDKIETIIPVEAGFWPNDLVLAPDGGFYFSDFHSSATDASGGVYYVSPDFRSITPVIKNLAQANGVAFHQTGRHCGPRNLPKTACIAQALKMLQAYR